MQSAPAQWWEIHRAAPEACGLGVRWFVRPDVLRPAPTLRQVLEPSADFRAVHTTPQRSPPGTARATPALPKPSRDWWRHDSASRLLHTEPDGGQAAPSSVKLGPKS